MNKGKMLLLSALLLIGSLRANSLNATDSLTYSSCRFKAQELILPVALVAAGATGFIEPIKNYKVDVREYIADYRPHRVTVDNYVQYLPLASVYGFSLAGVKARHGYIDRTLLTGTSYVTLFVLVNGLKYSIHSPRPYNRNGDPAATANNSFPSGHTATAFMGAELVRLEYGDASPWYGVAAYTVATGVAALRVYNEKHWFTDVIAGAGIGILSARIGNWLLPYTHNVFTRLTGGKLTAGPAFYGEGAGLALRMDF